MGSCIADSSTTDFPTTKLSRASTNASNAAVTSYSSSSSSGGSSCCASRKKRSSDCFVMTRLCSSKYPLNTSPATSNFGWNTRDTVWKKSSVCGGERTRERRQSEFSCRPIEWCCMVLNPMAGRRRSTRGRAQRTSRSRMLARWRDPPSEGVERQGPIFLRIH